MYMEGQLEEVFVTMNIKLMYPIGEQNNRDLGFKISIDSFLEYFP